VTKPVDTADLLLRVRNAVRSKQLFNRLQEQYDRLQTLEKLRDSLVHMVVHDLRSPLGAVSAYLQLLESDPLSAEQRGCVAEARSLIAQIAGMANAVLDVNRLESGMMPVSREEVELVPLIRGALQALGPVTLHRVQFSPPDGRAVAYCDADLISRVIGNLVSNALKFSDGDEQVGIALEPAEGRVTLSVTDHGPGISAGDLERIFEKFGQVGPQALRGHHATGLGLTFCKMAVEANGGHIGVRSSLGQGSVFWFWLPTTVGAPSATGSA
jgi:signal transduction histidine kinase